MRGHRYFYNFWIAFGRYSIYIRAHVYVFALQIQRQYPAAFEFTSKLLLGIADHLHTLWSVLYSAHHDVGSLSQRFGTFLVNSDKEKNDFQLLASTLSLWAYVLAAKDSFVNDSYNPVNEEVSVDLCSSVKSGGGAEEQWHNQVRGRPSQCRRDYGPCVSIQDAF